MASWIWAYAAALAALTVLDGLWLGFVARDFYQREMVEVAAASFRKVPALLFYVAYPAFIVGLTLTAAPGSVGQAALRAAALGLLAYGTFDLTNMAVLKQWGVGLALTDMAWGTFITAAMGAAAYMAFVRTQ